MGAPDDRPTPTPRGRLTLTHLFVVAGGVLALLAVNPSGCVTPWETSRNLEEARRDKATLDAKVLHDACVAYRVREGAAPASLDALPRDGRAGGGLPAANPWGGPFHLEVRRNPASGADELVVWTTDPGGQRIQWPR